MILPILFILLVFFNCNFDENPQGTSSNDPGQNKKNEIILENMEILDAPYSVVDYPDEKDINWKSIKIPFIHKLPRPFHKGDRSFWIRGDFNIEGDKKSQSSDYYAIKIGLIAAVEQLHLNKQFIGEFKFNTRYPYKWTWPRSHILPAGIDLKKKNTAYIRLITNRKYITITSNIVLQDQTGYLRSENWNNFLFNQIPIGLSILLFGLFVFLIRNYFHFKIKRYLLYALFIFSAAVTILSIYSPTNFLDFWINFIIMYTLFAFEMLLIILIFQSIYGIYFTWHNIISASVLFIISICMFIRYFLTLNPSDTDIIDQPLKYFIIPFIIYLIYLIYFLNSLKSDKYKYKISISFLIIITFAIIIFSLTVSFNSWFQYFYIIWSTPVFIIMIIIYETREAKIRRMEFKRIYEILEKNNKINTLTESAEEKIERIIDFINENYTSDISREGLASAVDMSPNYMSRLFYVHTGKKVNKYINHLRITDAARQLKESNNGKRIIDIALATGFENLSTFNRIFKDILGITPTEYKKKDN